MSQDESCQDRQFNELVVLKSIFGDELRDLHKNKREKKWQPLDIVITLTPQKGMSGPAEVYAQVDLHVVCGENYPQEIPKISLQNSKGLSHQQLSNHLFELENLAKQLKGEVMIFELCQHIQKFLHEHNKPGYSSFYEEMVLRQQERLQYQLTEKQIKENQERQILQDEISKRLEALKEERRNHRESRLSLESDVVFSQSIPSSPHERIRTYSRRRCLSTSESSDSSLCEHRGTEILHFDNSKGEQTVCKGKCLGHSTKGSVVYTGIDTTSRKLLAITQWTLKCRSVEDQNNGETSNLLNLIKSIDHIEQELNHLLKMNHSNLVRYLNMKYLQTKDNIVIYILQEFVVGTTCSFFLMQNIPVDIDMLRHLAVGILSALEYLHVNDVAHQDLRDSSVHIDRSGVVKLSDYSLDKQLSDIYQANCLTRVEHNSPTTQKRREKKADIFRFGILMLSLLRGAIVTEKDIELDSSVQPDLKDFINKCLTTNERNRWSAQQLMQHCFIKTPIERGLSVPRLDGNQEQIRVESEQDPDTNVQCNLPAPGGQSRIQNEFEVLEWLGQGAFGAVLKVRNKLDCGIYALKRIKLNPKKMQVKKITREVKLLSRLNHENVVRYYNSWIESTTIDDPSVHTKYTPSVTPTIKLTNEENSVEDPSSTANIEKLAPPIINVESNSVENRANDEGKDDSDQSSDSDDQGGEANDEGKDDSDQSSDSDDQGGEVWSFSNIQTQSDSSDSIEFQRDGTSPISESLRNSQEVVVEKNENETENDDIQVNEIELMYIQMEFCEKSTLRTAIDNGLYKEEERIWRLFREIVKGLAHIHQQGMIHRDLKPVNIFLDSNDHVKIGDFGLATNILPTFTQTLETDKESQIVDKGISYDIDGVDSMTGQVGTVLYAAPELSAEATKAIYNQKVDIYSLGIIFFEMCYKPLVTTMERVKLLQNLRSKDIILPPEMFEGNMINKVHLLRWILNHDPSQRPTSQELLASEYLPPLQLEEAKFQKVIRHTLSNSQSDAYKYLVACCFSQEVTAAMDFTYDINLPTRDTTSSLLSEAQLFQESIKSKIAEVFQKHGGIYVATPLLMPKSDHFHSFTDGCVRLMTRTGSVVSIPHDLRRPFARYIAWNNISCIRRYAIERVYRAKKDHDFHPCELYECAFDIVSPTTNNLIFEAELISIAWEICNEIPQLQGRDFTVRINHVSLWQAILMDCGIEREKYQDIYSILYDTRDRKYSRSQVQILFMSLCLTDHAMNTLYGLFEAENSDIKIDKILKKITKKKGDAAALAKEGLKEMNTVIANARALGVEWPITIDPMFVQNIQHYNGVFYQITSEIKKRRRRGGQDVIAAGGRYDNMLSTCKQILERTGIMNKISKQYGVGISISLDKLISAVGEIFENLYLDGEFVIDVAVCCSDGMPQREKELAEVLRELWSLGLRVTCLDFRTSEEILEYCRNYKIRYVVILKSGEKGYLRIETWERDMFQECKNSIQDIAEYFQRQQESTIPVTLNRSESKINANMELTTPTNTPANVNINFIIFDKDKLSGSSRRSYKNSILAQLSSHLQRISYNVPIEVFASFLETTVINAIINYLDFDDEQDFQKSVLVVIEKHPRYKKYITQISDELREKRNIVNGKLRPVLILYSLSERRYAMRL